MRLRLSIKRHELPLVQILHGVSNPQSTTVSELIAQVNTVIPLESEDGEWGLEDYIMSVGGFECVHYANVADVLKEDDEVEIRATQTIDARTRRSTGRTQISREGARLLDGLPYGSRRMRKTARPPIRIPPLKRRRLLVTDDDENEMAAFANESDEVESDNAFSDQEDEEATNESEANSEDISDEELAALKDDAKPAPTADVVALKSKKRKRSRSDRGNEDQEDRESKDRERSPVEWDDNSATSSAVASTASESGSETSESSDSSDSNNSDEAEVADHTSSGKQAFVDDDDSEGASSSSASISSSDTSNLTSSDLSDESESEEQPKDNMVDNVEAGPKAGEKLRKVVLSKDALERARHDRLIRRYTGLIHPTLQERLRSITKESPPGGGKKGTKARNERRKISKKIKYERKTQEQEALVKLTLTSINENSAEGRRVEKQPLRSPSEAEVAISQSHEQEEDAQAATEMLRDKLLRNIASDRPEKASHAVVGKSCTVQDDHDQQHSTVAHAAEGKPEIISEAAVPEVDRESKRLVSTATTGPRLRVGQNTRRTIISGLMPLTSKKKESAPPTSPPKRKWQDVIKLAAVECGATDIELTDPPFPFKQRWHGIPGRVFGKRRQAYLTSIRENYNVFEVGKKRKREQDDYVDSAEDEEQVEGSDAGLAEGDAREHASEGLNYDEEDPSGDSHTLKGPSTSVSSAEDDHKDIEDGYPREPIDIEQLKPLTEDICKIGAFIYFKKLELSPGGSPQMTSFRTARIEGITGKTLDLKLARRDVPVRDEEVERHREKFQVEAQSEADQRNLTVDFDELVEPSVITT